MFAKRYVIEAVFEDGFEELNREIERHRNLGKARARWAHLEYTRLYVQNVPSDFRETVWHYQLRDTRTGATLAPTV